MNTERSKSPLQFFADLGELLARYATKREFAIGMVIVSFIWPIGTLIAGLLIASIYWRGQHAVSGDAGSPPSQPSKRVEERTEELLLGLALIGFGLFLLAKNYFGIETEILLPIAIVVGGVVIIWLAYARKGADHVQ